MRAALLAAVALGTAAAPAHAVELTTLEGIDAPGPARYDKVGVVKVGPVRARHVLVFEPGTSVGAGYFIPLARDLVRRLPGWQVWAVERRENLFEDHSMLDRVRAGKAAVADLFPYYLGWLTGTGPTQHFQPPTDAVTAPAREWGMRVAVEDLRRVIRAARKGGRTVVLGGHSLGGTITTAYASWDFGGRAGARDLGGLVFIDGGSSSSSVDAEQARTQLDAIAAGSPFNDLVGLGVRGRRACSRPSVSGFAGVDGFAWPHPRRLSLDASAVAGGAWQPGAGRARPARHSRARRAAADLRVRDVARQGPRARGRAGAGEAGGRPGAQADAGRPQRDQRALRPDLRRREEQRVPAHRRPLPKEGLTPFR
jgi:hypothetical protein